MTTTRFAVILAGIFLFYSLEVLAVPSASNVSVLPLNATAGHDIYCNYNYTSPINENYSEQGSNYEWWKNSINQGVNSQRLAFGNLTPNDQWYCKVTASDGQNNGTTVQSSNTVTILGTVQNPVMYVATNKTWSANGYYSDVQRVVDLNDELVSALDTCTADAEGYCNVSLNFSSSSVGVLNITDLEIYYEQALISLEISSLSTILSNGTVKVFEFVIKNNGTSSVSNVTWKLNLGDGTVINSTRNTSLAVSETMFVYVYHNYSSEGQYTVTANATAVADGVNTMRTLSVSTSPLSITSLKVLYSNLSEKVFEFAINNSGDSNISSNWTLSFGDGNAVSSVQNANLNSSKSLFVYVQHNYAAQGDYSVTATAQGGGLTATAIIPIEVEYLGVSNFSVLNISGTERIFGASVRNYMYVPMVNVSWSLNSGNGIVSSTSPITLQSQESSFVFVQYNYTATGTFAANFTAVNSSWNDLEALNVTIP